MSTLDLVGFDRRNPVKILTKEFLLFMGGKNHFPRRVITTQNSKQKPDQSEVRETVSEIFAQIDKAGIPVVSLDTLSFQGISLTYSHPCKGRLNIHTAAVRNIFTLTGGTVVDLDNNIWLYTKEKPGTIMDQIQEASLKSLEAEPS